MTMDKRYLDTLGVEQIFKLIKQNYVSKDQLKDFQEGDLAEKLAALKADVQKLVDENHLVRKIAEDGLPAVDEADERTIYMVPNENDDDEDNGYTEWLLIDGKFERIGSTKANFKDYYTAEQVDAAIDEINERIDDEVAALNSKAESDKAELEQAIADAKAEAMEAVDDAKEEAADALAEAKDELNSKIEDVAEEAKELFVKEENYITQMEIVAMFYSNGENTVIVTSDAEGNMNATVVDDIATAIAEAPANSLVYVTDEEVIIPAGTEIADGVTIIANGGTIVC